MTPLPWHEVEMAIQKEVRWLSDVLDFGPYTETDPTPFPANLSHDTMLRQIAIAIVRGTIQAREIKSATPYGLWTDNSSAIEDLEDTGERHGGHWHQTMMRLVKDHFIHNSFTVINEPSLSLGRADLGVYKDGHTDMFIEIGTTSLFKTWFNTKNVTSAIFLFVPTDSNAIEFVINDNPTTESIYREFYQLRD